MARYAFKNPLLPSELEKISKLPKWAQDHIASLERQIEDLKTTLAKAKGDPTNTMLNELSLGEKFVPDDTDIKFKFSDGTSVTVYRDDRGTKATNLRSNRLRIYSDKALVVRAVSSNVITVQPCRDW